MSDSIEIGIETVEVERMIGRLLTKIKKPRKLLNMYERYLRAVTVQMFRGRRPDKAPVRNVRWPENARSTILAKRAAKKRGKLKGGTIRPGVYSGKLRDSIKVLSRTAMGFIFGSNVKSDKGFDYPGHLQQKYPWLFLNKKDYAQWGKAAADYLNDVLKGYQTYTRGL